MNGVLPILLVGVLTTTLPTAPNTVDFTPGRRQWILLRQAAVPVRHAYQLCQCGEFAPRAGTCPARWSGKACSRRWAVDRMQVLFLGRRLAGTKAASMVRMRLASPRCPLEEDTVEAISKAKASTPSFGVLLTALGVGATLAICPWLTTTKVHLYTTIAVKKSRTQFVVSRTNKLNIMNSL